MRSSSVVAVKVIAVALTLVLSGCSTFVPTPTSDPFTAQLNRYYAQRKADQAWMIASVSTAAAGAIGATTFNTLNSLNLMDPHAATIGTVISAILGTLAAGSTIWAFVEYDTSNNNYMETLKLQTQYYNLLQPPRLMQ